MRQSQVGACQTAVWDRPEQARKTNGKPVAQFICEQERFCWLFPTDHGFVRNKFGRITPVRRTSLELRSADGFKPFPPYDVDSLLGKTGDRAIDGLLYSCPFTVRLCR
ncbi:MAG: hypothetical protein OXE94_14460 [Aestuariivita sp.]|nr:hypothetical protein [Aestuariivita sp.]MCY4202868.1 hypothetical protein [Aestuariivita sp.]